MAVMLLAMLAIVESHRVQRHVRFVSDPDPNSGASASWADRAGAGSGARSLALTAALADPSSREFASIVTRQVDLLLTEVVGNPKLQEEIRALTGEVLAMYGGLLREQSALVAEQLQKVKMDENFQDQAKQVLEQAKEVVTQMEAMMTDPHLQGEAERIAKQMERGMEADGEPRDHAKTLAKRAEATEAIMPYLGLPEHAGRLFKQLKAMKANQLMDQLMETLVADPNFQRHARRIATHVEAIRDILILQKADGGPTLDLFSLAEVNRSDSEVSFNPLFVPPSLLADKRRMSAPQPGVMPRWPLAAGVGVPRWRRLQHVRMQQEPGSETRDPEEEVTMSAETRDPGEEVTPPPLPKIKTMRVGDGTLAGDMNFDPLGFSDTPDALAWYRESEIKHARLAMLAAIGWPVSELTNFGKLLTPDGRAPALLNGGLEKVSGAFFAAVIALQLFYEVKGFHKRRGMQDDYLPGMLDFDLFGWDSQSMREAEILNGRVAMAAITLFALEEAITKAPIFPINLITR